MKPCKKCGSVDRYKSGGCRPCQTIRSAKWRTENPEKNRDSSARWYAENREKADILHAKWDAENPEKLKAIKAKWNSENPDYQAQWQSGRRKTDVQFLLACNLRSRLGNAIRGIHKEGSAIQDLGCSVSELRAYLEAKFQTGMSWANYGPKGWHIDHIIPLSKFDLSDREQLLKACHFTNLQPLWALGPNGNLSKGNKIKEAENGVR